jgi:prepilin-type N-terminal cleavage/methylation domain-containing protein
MRHELNSTSSRKSSRGFTLIELLVVIAIIALLLAILMPALTKVKKIAKRVVCMTNVRSFGQAFHSYASENDDRIIKLFFEDTGKFWTQTMIDHYGAENLRLCPEAIKPTDEPYMDHQFNLDKWKPGAPDRAWAHLNDTGDDAGIEFIGSYGTNGWVHSDLTWGSKEKHWGGKMSDCNSEVPLMLDCIWTAGFPLLRRPADGGEPFTKAEMENWSYDTIMVRGEVNRYCFDRHDKLINIVFIDGSTRSVKVDELWLLRWTKDFPKKTVEIEW